MTAAYAPAFARNVLRFVAELAFVCLAVTALGGRVEARFPRATMSSAGFGRPLLVLVATAVAIGALPGGWLHRLAASRLTSVEVLLLLGVPLYAIYVGNGRLLTSGDNLGTRLIAPQLLEKGSLDLSDAELYRRAPLHYSALRVGGRILPSFPIGTGLLSVPMAASMRAAGMLKAPFRDAEIERFEKYSGALLATASALLLFVGIRRRGSQGVAFGATLVFALGTTAATTSQGLWSTSGEMFCLCAAIALLLREDASRRSAAIAGLFVAFAFFCRPTALIAGGAMLLVLLATRRRAAGAFAIAAGSGVAIASAWLYSVYGHPLGAYALMNSGPGTWARHPLEGLAGTLISPSRGVLLHQPYLLLIPLVWVSVDPAWRAWRNASALVLASGWLLAGCYVKWWGGHSIGPRLFTETAPFVALLTVPLWQAAKERRVLRIALVGSVAFAAATQLLGLYNARALQWNLLADIEQHPDRLWSIRNSQLAASWIPRWRLLDASPPPAELADASRFARVDLSPAANTRYDLDPFGPYPRESAQPHYARLDAARFNRPRALFHFAPAGRWNAITTGGGARPAALPVPDGSFVRLHAILAAGVTRGTRERMAIGEWRLQYADGTEAAIPIRLNVDVFEYHREARGEPVPVAAFYWGGASDSDALVHAVFDLGGPKSPRSIALVGVGRPVVTVLAVSLERPER